ncbi:MAG: carbohydrate ABC transporter permease [Clostridiaceae bacterium]|nr:carbohydrate ABC transporter permease [Clostridiaceae bacterium]
MKRSMSDRLFSIFIYIFLIVFVIICLYPMVLTLSVSFSDEQTVALNGFKLIPEKFSTFTYKYFFMDKGTKILNAYTVTLFVVIVGTLASLIVTTGYAYATSVKTFKLRNALSFFAFFTMLFNGGMLPWYILCTKYYQLNNKIYGLILPYLMNVFLMYIVANFIKTIPDEIYESAKIDGAGHFTIFIKLVLPIAKVGIITITLFYALQYWNDWYLALMLISDEKLYPVQYLLYTMLANAQFVASGQNSSMSQHIVVPVLTSRMAMTCVATGPIILAYPLVQKYFVKGITLGAVKG